MFFGWLKALGNFHKTDIEGEYTKLKISEKSTSFATSRRFKVHPNNFGHLVTRRNEPILAK